MVADPDPVHLNMKDCDGLTAHLHATKDEIKDMLCAAGAHVETTAVNRIPPPLITHWAEAAKEMLGR